jgi:phage baseplate assembly protein W
MTLRPSREIAFPFHIGSHGGIAYVEDVYKTHLQHIVVTVLTSPGERVMATGFGAPTYEYLFENLDEMDASELSLQVRNAIETWEPAVVLHDVKPIINLGYEGELRIEITFSVPPRQDVLSTVVDVGGAIEGGLNG